MNRVILKWNANAAKSFKIQASTDNSSWEDVFSTDKGSSSSVTDETFPTTNARYVRMLATERAPMPAVGRGGGGRNAARGAAGAREQAGAVLRAHRRLGRGTRCLSSWC